MKRIYIPSNLNLSKLVDNDKDLDRLHYILNLIYEQRILYNRTEDYVPLKAIYLRNLIARNYNDYVKFLINNGIIECDGRYVKNEKSLGYRLCPPYADVKHKEITLKTMFVQRNVDRWQAKRMPTTDIHIFLYKMLRQLDIKYDQALNYVNLMDVDEYNSAKISIDKFKNKEFFLYSDDYGRVHTNVTNLKSTLRKYLTYATKELINIDIVNSQPLLLIPTLFPTPSSIRCTLSTYFENNEMDFWTYKSLVEQGKLYDYLMKEAGETNRSDFKEKFFREIFFGKKTNKLFCRLFPSVASELMKAKSKDYRTLAWRMQRTESKLMISNICRRIMEEHEGTFMATIHDSILTTPDNESKIKKIMYEEFAEIGLVPTIRTEST